MQTLATLKMEISTELQVFFANNDVLYIDTINEPSFPHANFHVINARHPLLHFTLLDTLCFERPVFKAISPIPLASLVMELVKELHGL